VKNQEGQERHLGLKLGLSDHGVFNFTRGPVRFVEILADVVGDIDLL
jgi:hypothetical protein